MFAIGGVLGLVVDAGTVQALVVWGGWNPYLARVLSFLLAATVTWAWNRRHTFAHRDSGHSAAAEWLHWLALMGVGACVNYAIYAALLLAFEPLRRWPALPAAAGSAVAALVNFSTARGVLFRRPKRAV
ncbi:GtrA family protein [Frateuria terrea]|uniref:Putative flippase GtrA (Transmembrane translocase of bactoprenol-linked glucose) n=2 Tax=Frateuria terrea TaxID=529704 RepID=A0A1H6TT98_9GAMM|nr:GtrA family protein [Frateuria terrea]SEI80467.1 Putative flippase GtrA (transmembrane translocase of bactoprenol-linked glucose) [Frateuria terrea]SFP41854.1 Putative flippase GtrA (transmembrane translocase of bactoprenol-linked glucose) [Frateuria terrea]